ncbi:PREDICTED: NACHT, LRR and PYD domains-containing protein 6 [Galeopterus variegatus]|uniref:NACHT, LRR and PYD domains-containing protein 6 n=1 Tax=Galeopterus variegatus TaxID=482537 RepID=A0ABM0RW09_GALVR|nr:PREDICTED: NACHT, LRR and PYD domains-containing protein 6 [Galeopterus variegatus]
MARGPSYTRTSSRVVSEHGKQDALRRVQWQGCPGMAPAEAEGTEGLEETEESEEEEAEELGRLLELLYRLYETQEDASVRQALRGLPELVLQQVRFSPLDLAVLSYCARCCPAGQAASRARRVRACAPDCPSGPVLQLAHCKLPDAVWRDLSEALRAAPALEELGLFHNRLSEAGLRVLCEGLAWSQCRVQTLRVQLPGLQGTLHYLVGMLRQSPALTTLDLSGCQLPGPLVTYLCAVLQHPACSLQTLSLASVELSEQSLQELRAMRTARPDLSITHAALDSSAEPPKGADSIL